MRYLCKQSLVIATLILSFSVAFSQYPDVPETDQRRSDSLLKAANKHSDSAWNIAWPIIQAEERQGKPYIAFANRPTDLPQSEIPAFPGAEGGGKYSFGGRGGRVIVVTNLNDTGRGSFRDACEQPGPRIVVFNVAGIIKLKAAVSVRAPYITILGNTAPG